MLALDILHFGMHNLTFYTWHDAPADVRTQLRNWVFDMQRLRDRENGPGPGGACAWLDEKIALSSPGGFFQVFVAVYCQEVVWTGSVVEDDRGMKATLADLGYDVDAFFGLFNTRYDLRGRGIGWTGANVVCRHVWGSSRGVKSAHVALVTINPAAERHYQALGFKFIGDFYVPAFGKVERIYLRTCLSAQTD